METAFIPYRLLSKTMIQKHIQLYAYPNDNVHILLNQIDLSLWWGDNGYFGRFNTTDTLALILRTYATT